MTMSIISETESEELSIPEEEDDTNKIGLYIGERNALSQRHGRGWAILPNGDQYDGQYRQGKRHGIGLYVFKGGARYYGKYRCGHRSGRGIFLYPDGSIYEGNWRKNIKHGKGRYNYPSGDSYSGDWYRGVRHGVGVYVFNTGDGEIIRFRGTWRQGVRDGPFEVHFGTDEKSIVLHGTWDNQYPQGPAVFSFDQKYMLMGFFQTKNMNGAMKKRPMGEEIEECEEDDTREECKALNEDEPSLWFAQDICIYDYSQLPQEPVPLPLSDSDISVCSLSTAPTDMYIEKSIIYDGEGEDEGEEDLGECIPCECSMSEIETESEPCTEKAEPCDIDVIKTAKC